MKVKGVRGWFARTFSAPRPATVHAAQPLPAGQQSLFDEYVDALPSAQNAVNLIPGWNHALPPEAGAVTNAPIVLYADPRIEWCVEQCGGIKGRSVLELGPLEASHTFMLHKHEPASICAVEANKLSFMRCLIVKELLHLSRAQFMLGDFHKWLEQMPRRYDLIVASGVLYHMINPVRLIELMAHRSHTLYLWTHYFSDVAMPSGDARRGAFSGEVEEFPYHGLTVRLHKRSYHGAWRNKAFCGGMHDEHSWMELDQILAVLSVLGFHDIRTAHEMTDHPNGPSLSIFATRSADA